ncbi:hypothetical protein AAH979_31850 [Plantactinospora sp. ZYX-F-223]|uniref:hypothetical protein n=1 Tax=Plantactinospora sp. ZYX-F-223 TaxID=3144103 RepID=UPI0031FD4101
MTVRPALLGPDAAVIGAALTSIDQVRQQSAGWLLRQSGRSGPARSRQPAKRSG